MNDKELAQAILTLKKKYKLLYGEVSRDYKVCLDTREDCAKEIKRQSILSEICDLNGYHKDRYSNPYKREVERLDNLLYFYESGVDWSFYGDGYVRVTKGTKGYPLIFALLSGKWRQEGKSVWYKSRDSQTFLEKYVLRDDKGD